jgi:hypothetical protein
MLPHDPLSVRAVSERAGCSEQAIYQFIRRGGSVALAVKGTLLDGFVSLRP